MINKIGLVAIRIIFVYFLGFNTSSFGAQVVAGDNAPRGARDGVLNVADILVMERFILGQVTPTAEEFKVANVAPLGAPDNVLNVADLLVLQRAVLGLVSLPPVNLGPDAPVLNSVASPTNSNPLPISGSSVASSIVHVYVNGVEQHTINADATGTFTSSIALLDGDNTVYAVTEQGGDFSPASITLTVNYVNNISRTQSVAIAQDTVWTPGVPNTPYVINGNLTTNPGVTLTIMPGTVLQFGAGAGLTSAGNYASGNLVVRGLPTSRVVFTSATHAAGAWSGIYIGNGSSINYATIEYANNGLSATGGHVSNSIIHNNVVGVSVSNGSPQIGPGNVITANGTGVDVYSNAIPVVTRNQIYNNTGYNYRAQGFSNPSAVVLNATNNWWGTAAPDAINSKTLSYTTSSYSPKTSPLINFGGYLNGPGGEPVNPDYLFYTVAPNTVLSRNTTYELINNVIVPSGVALTIPAGVGFDVRGFNSKLTIEGSLLVQGTPSEPVTFTSTQTQATSYRWQGIHVTAAGTAQFNHAALSYALAGITYAGTVADGGDCATQCIQNSQFINNYDGVALGNSVTIRSNIFQGNTQSAIRAYSGNARIQANTFRSNRYGINLLNSAAPTINGGNVVTANQYGLYLTSNTGSGPQPVVNDNSIYGNTTYNYYVSKSASFLINAKNNWWGTANPVTIASTIYDFKNDTTAVPRNNIGSPVVDFSGYRQSAGGIPTVENDLAAILTDTTLYAGQTYIAMSSLWIAPAATLTVQPGAILQFPVNAKLLVDGSLVVQEGASPAIFTSVSQVTGNWKGIEISSTATRAIIANTIIQYADKGVYFNGATLQDLTCSVFCVKNSIIQYNRYGLYLAGAARPMLTGNQIIYNKLWGIYLAGSGNDATSPNPVITNNDIYKNYNFNGTYYNGNGLYIYNYSSTTGIHINATGNWWGRVTPMQSYGTSTSSGNDILISSSSIPINVVNYSNAAAQPLYTTANSPTVSLTTSGAPFNAPATITLSANAAVSGGTISVVDFYNNATWLGNSTTPVGGVFNFTWTGVPVGTYTLTARATTNVGLSTTSSPVAVTVTGDILPTISMASPASGTVFYAPALIPLSVNTTNGDRTIVKVDYYNGSILLGESSAAPYGYTWAIVAPGAYSIRAVLTDNVGATIESAPISIFVNPITLSIDTSINNAIVNDDNMLVSGTFIAPPNSGVTVNGMLAILFKNTDGSYSYYANNVPLSIGNNTITVTLVSQDGQTAATSASVTSTGSPGFKIRADRVFDIQPNGTIEFEYQNTSGLVASIIEIDSNGDGIFESTTPVSSFSMPFPIYSTAQRWPISFRVLDVDDNVLYTTTQVIILSTENEQDSVMKPVIGNVFGRISQGNAAAALKSFTEKSSGQFQAVLSVLSPYTATITSELSNAEKISTGKGNSATYAILRAENGVNKVYIVNMIKGSDGVWRIDSM